MNASTSLLDISVANVKDFESTSCDLTSSFADGKLDGENNFEPVVYQWYNSDYRRGYLLGMAQRISQCAKDKDDTANNVVSIY